MRNIRQHHPPGRFAASLRRGGRDPNQTKTTDHTDCTDKKQGRFRAAIWRPGNSAEPPPLAASHRLMNEWKGEGITYLPIGVKSKRAKQGMLVKLAKARQRVAR